MFREYNDIFIDRFLGECWWGGMMNGNSVWGCQRWVLNIGETEKKKQNKLVNAFPHSLALPLYCWFTTRDSHGEHFPGSRMNTFVICCCGVMALWGNDRHLLFCCTGKQRYFMYLFFFFFFSKAAGVQSGCPPFPEQLAIVKRYETWNMNYIASTSAFHWRMPSSSFIGELSCEAPFFSESCSLISTLSREIEANFCLEIFFFVLVKWCLAILFWLCRILSTDSSCFLR